MIRVEHITKQFKKLKAVDDVSLEIKKGEIVCLIGPSGSGKSTVLRCINGLEVPEKGEIFINDELYDIKNKTRYALLRSKMGFVFQHFNLFPNMTVIENLTLAPIQVMKKSKEEAEKIACKYLDRVGLLDKKDEYPSKLSGGQKQRVAIARALINEPKVLLLDEPLSALDAKLRANLLIDLDRIHDQIGITFIYVTHDQAEALSVSDRIAVMNHGHVLQIGTPYEIYESPATQFVAQFIGETNLFDAEVVDCVPHKDVNGQDDFMATLKVPELGQQAPLATDTEATAALDRYMQVTDYEHTEKGQKVAFTIRPEKIRITLEPPATGSRTDVNVFSGIVEEPIYSGFQSKFYVRLETGKIIKVFKQHTDYMDEGPVIRWKDKVYVSWSAEDAYIVEDIEK